MVEQEAYLSNVFQALVDPTRRQMLRRLANRQHTVTELAAPFQMSLAAASKHIKALERAGLIERTIQGRTHICQLKPGPLAVASDWLRFYEQFWTGRLDALERELRHEAMEAGLPEARLPGATVIETTQGGNVEDE